MEYFLLALNQEFLVCCNFKVLTSADIILIARDLSKSFFVIVIVISIFHLQYIMHLYNDNVDIIFLFVFIIIKPLISVWPTDQTDMNLDS